MPADRGSGWGREGCNLPLDSLAASVNPDGGWSVSEDFETSDIKRTVLALRALDAAGYSDTGVIENGIMFLLNEQNWDGSWSFVDGADGDVYLTALTLLFLENYRDQYNLMYRNFKVGV